jgi:hypothetical protein
MGRYQVVATLSRKGSEQDRRSKSVSCLVSDPLYPLTLLIKSSSGKAVCGVASSLFLKQFFSSKDDQKYEIPDL